MASQRILCLMDVKNELDLRGIPCPLSWAHARVRLDAMKSGQRLVVILDEERGARDIPAAAEAAGYCAVNTERDGIVWRLEIEV